MTAASNVAITANAGNLSGTTLKSTVVTSSLTSVGTLGNLTVTSNISGGNVAVTSNTSTSNLVVGGSTPDTRVTIYGVGQSAIYAITGNSTATGTDLHISGSDSTQTRITQDSFGNSNSYVAFTGRSSRGSAATPLQSQTNDILSQFTGRGFSNGSLQFGNSSTGRVDVVAAENFTDTIRATKLLVYTTAVGAITPTATATFDNAGGFQATGTITAPNITANTGVFTGNANGLTNIPGANVTGTVPTATSATTAGTVTTAAQPNITSTGTLTSLTVTGNVSAGNVSGTLLTGTLATAAQPNVTSLGTLSSLAVTGTTTSGNFATAGNITASFLVSNVATGTAPLTVTSTTRVNNLNVAYANVSDYSAVTTATTGNYYLNFVNALTGNVQEYANSVFVANVSNGAITATTFVGAATGLTGIPGANVTGTVPSATTAGTVTTAAQGNITSVGTLTSLGVNGTVTAVAFTANTGVFTGNGSGLSAIAGANVTGTVSSATSATTAGTVTTAAQPNITSVGTLNSLTLGGTLTGAVQIGTGAATHFGTTLPTGANSTAGTITGNWSLSAGSRLNATYADLAEKYVADSEYAPGTVLVFGGEQEVTLANTFDSTRVAGVVTTNPAYTMNNDCQGEHVVNVALQGRVPVKVTGNVAKGDLMVTGENGRAVANNEARAGTIIGKSLENFIGTEGTIEVAVGRF